MTRRISFDGDLLVVPPFQCAWLTGQGCALRASGGCVCFQAKADSDVTVIFKTVPGTKRLQPLQHAASTPPPSPAAAPPQQPRQQPQHSAPPTPPQASTSVEPNYTIILGSHRNSCLKVGGRPRGGRHARTRQRGGCCAAAARALLRHRAMRALPRPPAPSCTLQVEKNGATLAMVQGVPGSRVSPTDFTRFWVNYHAVVGAIMVGAIMRACMCMCMPHMRGHNTCALACTQAGSCVRMRLWRRGWRAGPTSTLKPPLPPPRSQVGTGEPMPGSPCYQWVDPEGPIPDIQHVGLSCWDSHVSYRCIEVRRRTLARQSGLRAAPGNAKGPVLSPLASPARPLTCLALIQTAMGNGGVCVSVLQGFACCGGQLLAHAASYAGAQVAP